MDVYRLFETLADDVPLLTAIRPNGETSIEEFEDAGGTRALMKQLEPLLDGGALTVTGRTVAENLAGVTRSATPRSSGRPSGALGRRPTIVLIRGSLCPDGGIVKLAVADDRRLEFTGPALVFESAADALDGVKAGLIEPGQVVVLRGLGVTGSPGMGMASALVFALDGAGLTGQVAVVTDGQLSGLVNKGIVVGEVSPEAAAGGPLGLVRDGDTIRIDVPARTADLEVPPEELAERKAALAASPPARPVEVGWLSVYQRLVRPLPEGAVLRPRKGARRREYSASANADSERQRGAHERGYGEPGGEPREKAAGGVALAVTGLSVAYGNVVAVHDATFTVAEGDACAITGPNGNGKSSILMGVTGMVRRRGEVTIFGAPAKNGDVKWAARHGLTLVPERRQLYPDLTTADNIILGCYTWTRSIGKARRSDVYGRARRPLPRAQAAPETGGGHPVRRRAADGGDRPRPGRQPEDPRGRRAVPRPRRGGREAGVRGARPDPRRRDHADRRRRGTPPRADPVQQARRGAQRIALPGEVTA